jgi:hypothetical protein
LFVEKAEHVGQREHAARPNAPDTDLPVADVALIHVPRQRLGIHFQQLRGLTLVEVKAAHKGEPDSFWYVIYGAGRWTVHHCNSLQK